MGTQSRDKWIALHTQYLVDPQANLHGLIMDAQIFLDCVHGLTQSLSDAMHEDNSLNHDRLCSALHGIALLTEMGQRCIAQADVRMLRSLPQSTT